MTDQELEQALRRSLQPIHPGEDFSAGVIARLGASTTGRDPSRSVAAAGSGGRVAVAPKRWVPTALAACALAGIGLAHWQAEETRGRGLQARAQLLQALRIAGERINVARTTVIKEEEQPD